MLIGIAVRKAGKPRCGISLPVRREDEGELIDRVREIHVAECARKPEGSECGGTAGRDLIIKDQKGGQRVQGQELSPQGAMQAGTPRLRASRGRWLPPFGRPSNAIIARHTSQ